ncbi:hypothetical protein CapIbe_017965 [Capra ibex]
MQKGQLSLIQSSDLSPLLMPAWGVWCLGPPRAALSPSGPQTPPSLPGSLLENLGVTRREQRPLSRLRTPGPAESTH